MKVTLTGGSGLLTLGSEGLRGQTSDLREAVDGRLTRALHQGMRKLGYWGIRI